MSPLARLAGANNEGADQTAPMRGCYASLFFASNNIGFLSHVQANFSLHATQDPELQCLLKVKQDLS